MFNSHITLPGMDVFCYVVLGFMGLIILGLIIQAAVHFFKSGYEGKILKFFFPDYKKED